MVLAAAVAAACTPRADVDMTLATAPSSEVVVKILDVNRYQVLDTVRTDAAGRFTYKVELEKGQPEFVYVFYKDTKVASLLLEAGDKVSVTADTLGSYTVEGSDESQKLSKVENDYAAVMRRMQEIATQIESGDGDVAELRKRLGKEYVDYYRHCVKYVMENSRSLTTVPVFYQSLGENLPVFAQSTDAIHFINAADSLESVYPDSKYVKALRKEAERRYGYLELENKLKTAEPVGYPDIELPDIKAEKIRLSDVDSKVVLIYFWSASDAGQKMFNLDFLKKIYDDYHTKGFEIYQVALDPDKTSWAQVVKQQNLPWINVCDGLGADSPYVMTYNISSLPAAYILCDGELVDGRIVDEKALRKLLDKLLK